MLDKFTMPQPPVGHITWSDLSLVIQKLRLAIMADLTTHISGHDDAKKLPVVKRN